MIMKVFFVFLGQINIINIIFLPVYFPEINIRNNNNKFV
jgi:hypothetical protein